MLPSGDSKTPHRPASERVSWCLETSLFLKTPFLGWISVPTSFASLFIFYILSYLLLKTMGSLSGCLMSSASIQKLLCRICSVFKCSFGEFVGEKMVSPSYSSAILAAGCLCFFICCLDLSQISSKEQASFNFMAAVTICSDFGAPKNK